MDFDKNKLNDPNHFSEKDFNWLGNIEQKSLKKFIDEPFDLLIGYFHKNNIYLETTVLQSNATFKVGFSNVNQKLYDIEISEIPSNINSFLSELKKYLILLKKIKN